MHIYEKDGVLLPSVTTILQILGSDELMKWANIMGFKHKKYDEVRDTAAEFGDAAHATVRKIVDDSAPFPEPISNPITAYELNKLIGKFKKELSTHAYNTIATEKTLMSIKLGYAGTCDWLCTFDDILTLIDWKTSKRFYPKMLLQLGGYYNLLKECENIEVNQAAIMTIRPDKCKLHMIDKSMLIRGAESFNILASFYNRWTPLAESID